MGVAMRTVLCLGLGLMLAGCERELEQLEGDPMPPEACLEVEPASLDFGTLVVHEDVPRSEVVDLVNPCEGDLEIHDLELADPEAPFHLGSVGSVLVPGGERTQVVITFEPTTAGAWLTDLVVSTNDPDHPVVPVPLSGEGAAPVLDLSCDSDLGAPVIGCETWATCTLANTGNQDLVVEAIDLWAKSAEIWLESPFEVPFGVAPGLAADVEVHYLPVDEDTDSGTLAVVSNDLSEPGGEHTVSLEGQGVALWDRQVETFEQSGDLPVDIVVTLDRNTTTAAFFTSIQANADDFVEGLLDLGADFQAAVIVADDGCVLGSDPWIDTAFSPSDAADAWDTMADLDFTLSEPGDSSGRGFTLAEVALSSENLGTGGCNEGLVRDEARLALVHITAEPEQSVNPYTYYVALISGLKDDPALATVNAVAGDYPSGCDGASAGTGYYEASVVTGGMYLSICQSDWGEKLVAIAGDGDAPGDSFELAQVAVPGSVQVVVDEVEVTEGWAFYVGLNSVVFEPEHVPETGATLEISYHLQPAC